ncbi:aminopeptidase N-like isoform X4 [Nylanderia fulva]|uniref:aminopeptidase N-like isoform X4 n=1 Tax=Nylanderia fulva TaxID=613905 RepID=UPI0010FB2239|nr:aminopeptidase N-like isoform X4 [Nylanderia fulva]
MIILNLLLISEIIYIVGTASTFNESSLCYQPSKYIKPNHYDIEFISYIEEYIFYGEYNISISILNKTRNILINKYSEKLYFKNIVLIKNLEKHHENIKYTVYKPTYDIQEDIIDVSFKDELLPGNYTLYIKYFGFTDEVFRIFNVKKKIALVAVTYLHIIGTRQMSSCWDQQYLFLGATFNISIGCDQCTALSNMPLQNTEKNKHNILLKRFDTTPAMSPYLATIIVSNYLLRVDNYIQNIEMWCRNNTVFHMEFAKNVAENITLFFKNKWKQHSSNISKVTHVAIPNFPDNGIIVFGLVLYNEMDIVYDKNLYSVAHKIEVAQLVGHKVTQQWFYNLNNPFRSAFWFNKALTTLLAMNTVNKIYSDNRIINLFVVQNQHTSFYLDGDYRMWNSTSQDDSLSKIRESIRAPCILRMMQHAVTKEIFWKGIRSYANSNQFHRQSFMTFLEEVVADAKNVDIEISLQTMKYWTLEEHCPLIKVVRNYNISWSHYNISIQNSDILKIDCVPVIYTIQSVPDFDSLMHRLFCKSKDILTFTHNERGWIIVNVQQIGYYRVNYDDENWRRISDYLYYDDFTTIHVLNRAQIIDDAFHLMIADQLEASIFWSITSYLDREIDYIAWYPMFKALEYMFSTFPVDERTEKYADKINKTKTILNKLLAKIKYEEIDDADELRICLRQEAARWACFLGDITCMKKAKNKLEQHLQDPIKHRLLPWWTAWTYCRGLMITTMNETTLELMYIRKVEATDIKFSEYMACINYTDFIKMYLFHKQHSNTREEDQFLVNSFLHFITKHAKNPIILQYIVQNFNEIKLKNVNIIAALSIMINNVYSKNLALKIMMNAYSILETNLVEVNNTIHYRRLQIKEMRDSAINYIYARIITRIYFRNKQIRRQKQYFESLLF